MGHKVYGSWLMVHGIVFLLALLTFVCQPTAVYAQPISSAELINNAKKYNGQVVVFEGEAIGEVMVRGDYVWANLSDGSNAIGVWMPLAMADPIKYTGNYKYRGDWVEVIGIFNRACVQHGGDLDIHAQSLEKTLPGRAVRNRINTNKITLVLILLGVLILVWILRLLQRK